MRWKSTSSLMNQAPAQPHFFSFLSWRSSLQFFWANLVKEFESLHVPTMAVPFKHWFLYSSFVVGWFSSSSLNLNMSSSDLRISRQNHSKQAGSNLDTIKLHHLRWHKSGSNSLISAHQTCRLELKLWVAIPWLGNLRSSTEVLLWWTPWMGNKRCSSGGCLHTTRSQVQACKFGGPMQKDLRLYMCLEWWNFVSTLVNLVSDYPSHSTRAVIRTWLQWQEWNAIFDQV